MTGSSGGRALLPAPLPLLSEVGWVTQKEKHRKLSWTKLLPVSEAHLPHPKTGRGEGLCQDAVGGVCSGTVTSPGPGSQEVLSK